MRQSFLPYIPFNPVLPSSFRIFVPEPEGMEKGLLSEKRAGEALTVMMKRGSEIRELKTPPIISVRYARGDARLERKGIDYIVTHEGGYEVPVQIKSSERGARRFARKHRLRESKQLFNAITHAVVVEPYEEIRSVIRKMAHYLNMVFSSVKKIRERVVSRIRRSSGRKPKGTNRVSANIQYLGCCVRC